MQLNKGTSFLRVSLGALVLAGSAFAQEPAPPPSSSTSADDSGISLGLRAGFGVPIGKAAADVTVGTVTVNNDLSKSTAGIVPLQLDIGYRFLSNWYVGGFFQYAFVLYPSGGSCPTGASCNRYDMRFGINGHYHFLPGQMLDPWVGIGAAYEIYGDTGTANSNINGFEFVNGQVGLDWTISPQFAVGPFATFTVAQFSNSSAGSITNTAIHDWLIFGLRGVFNFNM